MRRPPRPGKRGDTGRSTSFNLALPGHLSRLGRPLGGRRSDAPTILLSIGGLFRGQLQVGGVQAVLLGQLDVGAVGDQLHEGVLHLLAHLGVVLAEADAVLLGGVSTQ